MDGRQPEQISEVLATLLDKGDTGKVADLYEDEAVFADFDATVSGLDDILRAHQQFSDAGKRLILNESVVFEVDDIALVHWSWTVRNADGSSRTGISAEVLRRQPDGTWKFIIDNSDGTALVGSPQNPTTMEVDCKSTPNIRHPPIVSGRPYCRFWVGNRTGHWFPPPLESFTTEAGNT